MFPRAGSTTCTNRNLLRVTPTALLLHAEGVCSTFTSCGPHPKYTFYSRRVTLTVLVLRPGAPAALNCPATAGTRSKYTLDRLCLKFYNKELRLTRRCAFVTQAEPYQMAGVPEYQCRFVWKGVGDMLLHGAATSGWPPGFLGLAVPFAPRCVQ